MKRKISARHLLMILGILMMAGGIIALVSYKASAHSQPDVSWITGTTQAPTCQQLAQEYGDDGLCAGGN